jgi:hypothetical protein
MINYLKILSLLFLLISFTACENNEIDDSQLNTNRIVKIILNHKVDNVPFTLNTNYTNAFGEAYTVNKFQYYISNVKMHKLDNSIQQNEAESYHLINIADANTQNFSYQINDNEFDAITFYIGVDSLRNVSGAQSGALDPLNGMFWTWNTGYIMAKLEGSSPVSTSPNNAITHHIGGFKSIDNTVRKITFFLPNGAIKTPVNGTCEITIEANLSKWFNGVHNMKIADVSFNMSTGANAIKFADNYASMFKIISVVNK